MKRREFFSKLFASAALGATARVSVFTAILAKVKQAHAHIVQVGAWRSRKVLWSFAYGRIFASRDGVSFPSRTTAPYLPTVDSINGNFADAAYNGSIYLVVSADGPGAAISTNLSTWTKVTLPWSGLVSACDAVGSTFIILSADGPQCATSTDGVNWTVRTMPGTNNYTCIRSNGSIALAFDGATSQCVTSTDGITWTTRALPLVATPLVPPIWNGTSWALIDVDCLAFMISTDTINWSSSPLPATGSSWYYGVAQGSRFVIYDPYDHISANSTDGVTWTTNSGAPFYATGLSANASVVVAMTGGNYYRSTDYGATWTSASITSGLAMMANTSRCVNGVVFALGDPNPIVATAGLATCPVGSLGNNSFTARAVTVNSWAISPMFAKQGSTFIGTPGWRSDQCIRTVDGASWTHQTLPSTQTWNSCASNGTLFVMISNTAGASTAAASSPDGITWTARTLPSASWTDVASNGSGFVAVSSTTTAARSADGQTWTSFSMPASYNSRIIWTGSSYCVVSYNTPSSASSPDGVTWTTGTLPFTLSGVAYGNKILVGVSNSGIATSTNGTTWTAVTSPPAGYYSTIAFNGVQFTATSYSGDVAVSPDGTTWTVAPHQIGVGTVVAGTPLS